MSARVRKIGGVLGAACIFTLSLYGGIGSFSWSGLVGTLLLTAGMAALAVRYLHKELQISFNGWSSLILVLLSLGYLILCKIEGEYWYTLKGIGIILALLLLVVMINAAACKKSGPEELVLGALLTVGIFYITVATFENLGTFTPDSFSYYEIAQSFGNDFGKINTIRQYVKISEYNLSFPYFYPLLLFVVDKITQLGHYSGVLLNLLMCYITVAVLLWASKKYFGSRWAGAICGIILLFNPYYLDEVSAARSIPVAILCAIVTFLLLLQQYLFPNSCRMCLFWAGVTAGISAVTRFDNLALVLYCLMLTALIERKKLLSGSIKYGIGMLIPTIPWAAYSLKYFKSVWISDNMGTLFLVDTVNPSYVQVPGDTQKTLFNAPKEWFFALLNKISMVWTQFLNTSFSGKYVIIGALIIIAALLLARRKLFIKDEKNAKILAAGLAVFVYYGLKTFEYMLVGYGDRRYHVETWVVCAFFLTGILVKLIQTISTKSVKGIVWIALGLLVAGTVQDASWKFTNINNHVLRQVDVVPTWAQNIEEALESAGVNSQDGLLVLERVSYDFGGWSGWKVYAVPSVMTAETVSYMLESGLVDAEYILIPQEKTEEQKAVVEWLDQNTQRIPFDDGTGRKLYKQMNQ